MSIFYYGINDLDRSGNLLFLVNVGNKMRTAMGVTFFLKAAPVKGHPFAVCQPVTVILHILHTTNFADGTFEI